MEENTVNELLYLTRQCNNDPFKTCIASPVLVLIYLKSLLLDILFHDYVKSMFLLIIQQLRSCTSFSDSYFSLKFYSTQSSASVCLLVSCPTLPFPSLSSPHTHTSSFLLTCRSHCNLMIGFCTVPVDASHNTA